MKDRRPRRFKIGAMPCYALSDAARLLGRSRPTLMRWLPALQEVTGHAAQRDGDGRWFVPVLLVDKLRGNQELLERLARHAGERRGDTLYALRREVEELKGSVKGLEGEVRKLRRDVDEHCKHAS